MKKLIFLFVFLFGIATHLAVSGQDEGEAAPDFTVDLLDGGTFTLSDNLGKVVLIYFFGSDCSFCEASGPHVQVLYESFDDNPLFVTIGLDTWDHLTDEAAIREFANATGVTFPLAYPAKFVLTDYSWYYDRLVVIDKEGVIKRKANVVAGNDIDASSLAIQEALAGTVGVEEIAERISSTVYPVPAKNVLYLDLYMEEASDVEWIISDITGKERKRVLQSIGSGQQTISMEVEDMEKGIYFYSLKAGDRADAGKLIIQ